MLESENAFSVFLVAVVMFIHKCCVYYSSIIAGVPGCCYLTVYIPCHETV